MDNKMQFDVISDKPINLIELTHIILLSIIFSTVMNVMFIVVVNLVITIHGNKLGLRHEENNQASITRHFTKYGL